MNFLYIVHINGTNSSKLEGVGWKYFLGITLIARGIKKTIKRRGERIFQKNPPRFWIELEWISNDLERQGRHFWLVEIYICIWTGAYSFDKSRFFNGHSLDSKRNSLLTHLSKLHDIIRTFTNDQPLNLDEKYSRIEYRVAENRKFPVKERELKRMKYYSNRANEPIVSHPMELHIENDYDITGCKLFNVHLNTRSFPVGHWFKVLVNQDL